MAQNSNVLSQQNSPLTQDFLYYVEIMEIWVWWVSQQTTNNLPFVSSKECCVPLLSHFPCKRYKDTIVWDFPNKTVCIEPGTKKRSCHNTSFQVLILKQATRVIKENVFYYIKKHFILKNYDNTFWIKFWTYPSFLVTVCCLRIKKWWD